MAYMPLAVDMKNVIVFGGEREEGLQKTEKLAVFADKLLVVPETDEAPDEIVLESGPLNRVPESLSMEERRVIPVASEPASRETIPGYLEGHLSFVTSDLEDRELNEQIAEICRERNILCNIIDQKDLCNTWLLSVIDAPNMMAGISTKGGCAFYSQRTRIELEEELQRRSEISRILTTLRSELREQQCTFCVLEIVYQHQPFQDLLEQQQWETALHVARERARRVPDDTHVRDHSVSPPEPEKRSEAWSSVAVENEA